MRNGRDLPGALERDNNKLWADKELLYKSHERARHRVEASGTSPAESLLNLTIMQQQTA